MDMFQQPLGDGEGQESLVCRSTWGLKELDMTESLNNDRQLDFVRSHDLVSDTSHIQVKPTILKF